MTAQVNLATHEGHKCDTKSFNLGAESSSEVYRFVTLHFALLHEWQSGTTLRHRFSLFRAVDM